jgi:hypothetical protein
MKRFAPLALIVLALAIVPAAFADDSTAAPTQPTAPSAVQPTQPGQQKAGRPGLRMRIEILRLRMRIVELRFRLHCGQNGNASHDKCVAFAQKVEDRLTKLDGNVQAKLTELKACTPDSTDPKCKNADKKIEVLTKVDAYLQKVMQKVQDWLNGTSSTSSSSTSSDSALDQAAGSLSQAAAAGSNG